MFISRYNMGLSPNKEQGDPGWCLKKANQALYLSKEGKNTGACL